MRALFPFIFCLVWLQAAAWGATPSEAEIALFNPAAKAFQDGFYQRAEREMGDFVQKFPGSERKGEAILIQAQARFQLGLYEAAIRLLTESVKAAGALTDHYLFWIGESNFHKANYKEAGETFARLLKESPQSPLVLASSYGQANALFKLNDLARTIELLKPATGDFQRTAATSTNRSLIAKGFLLLAEAQLLKKDYAGGRETLGHLSLTNLPQDQEWARQQLLARLEILQDNRAAALGRTTNLVTLAQSLKQPGLLAQAYSLQAEVLQLLEKPVLAAEAYERILTIPALPANILRQSLQRIVEMLIAQNQLTNAMERLGKFILQNEQDPSRDVLEINLGEIKLKQFKQLAAATNIIAANTLTNLLESARTNFDFVTVQLTNSPLVGKALLNRGWILWEQAKLLDQPARLLEAQGAFESAKRKLPHDEDQATAWFKWADCQYQLKDYNSAITNYLALLQAYDGSPKIKTVLFDQLYYQIARVRLDQNDLPHAAEAVENLRRNFATNPLTEHAMLLYGQALIDNGKADPARESLLNFTRAFPLSKLKPEAELALARTYIRQRDWTNAIERYSVWLTNYPQHPSRPQALFDRAWVSDLARQDTNAFSQFSSFVTNYPNHHLAPKAQHWIANYYFNQESWTAAEQGYQKVFQNTNWAASSLTFEARLMAAKTAFQRQGYNDAKGYLTNLLTDPKCPVELRPEAYFMLGDMFLEQPPSSTNALVAYSEAIQAFDSIPKQYTNRLTVLAWGKIGDCHLNYASQTPESYAKATNAYQMVLDWKATPVPVQARNQAEFGLGACLEGMAKLRPPAERTALLEGALDHYLNVVYGKNLEQEQPDPFWLKKSVLAAGRLLSESLNRKAEAVQIYKRAREPLPSLRKTLDQKIESLTEPPATN